MPQRELNRAQQKLAIKSQIDLAKKELGKLNAAVSALERAFVGGTVPDAYYVGRSQSPRDADRNQTILSWPLRSIFGPILCHASMVERTVTDLVFDIFPPDLADQFLSNQTGNLERFRKLVRESKDREKYQKSKSPYP